MIKPTLLQLYAGMFLLFSVSQSSDVCAQNELGLFKLGAYEEFSKVRWKDSVYLLPQFQMGTLTYNHGFQVEGSWPMNYNRYFESMDMVSDAGDTLSVKRTSELKFINLQGRTFHHDYNLGYIEILTKTPVALGVKHIMVKPSHQYALDLRGYTSVYDRYYVNAPLYFFLCQNNSLYKANYTSILRLYPEHKEEIKEYLKAESINFYKEDDLIRLLIFCKRFDLYFEKSESPEYFRIPANENISTVPWQKEIYAYDDFQLAHVIMRDRRSFMFDYKVNYNYFSGSLDYINANSDTLSIRPSTNIRIVNIDGDVYCYNSGKGYIRLLFQNNVSLGVKNEIKLIRKELLEEDSIGESHSEPTETAYNKNKDNPKATTEYDRLYTQTASYFFINNKFNAFPANQQMIFIMFPGYKKEVAAYLNKNKPDFKNQEELIKLVSFCNQLPQH